LKLLNYRYPIIYKLDRNLWQHPGFILICVFTILVFHYFKDWKNSDKSLPLKNACMCKCPFFDKKCVQQCVEHALKCVENALKISHKCNEIA
jgi:hypothetical protein